MSTEVPTPTQLPPSAAARDDHATGPTGPRSTSARNHSPALTQSASPALGRAELVWVALTAVALAVLTSWPLVLHLPSRIVPDLGDPVRTAWQIAWVGHAMLHVSPHAWFDANAFYPHPLSLAFSDSLLGYSPAGFLGAGPVAALVRYNLLYLFAWSLCFAGAYLLARELGLRLLGAAAAGVAFAYAPYRITEAGHLHVISSGGIPLALFLLLRGYRRRSRWLVLAGWLVSAWQVSLGFTLGMQYCYLLALLAAIAAWRWWRGERPHWRGDRPPRRSERPSPNATHHSPTRALLAISLAGIAALALVAVYQARPYLKVAADYPTARRTIQEVERYSSGPAALLAASPQNRVWGGATAPLRDRVGSKTEDLLFPGLTILVLAALGLRAPLYSRRLRLGLLAGAASSAVLALGLGLTGAGYPYRLLYDCAPGWDGVRVPGRIFMLATLALALLAGAGAQWLLDRARGHTRGRGPLLVALVGGALFACLLGEGVGRLAQPVVPEPARAEVGLPGPLLDLPTDEASDRIWQYFSTNGFPKLANGTSTFEIPAEDDLRGGMRGFPDPASVAKLRWYGIRTVVLHLRVPALPPVPSWEQLAPPDPTAAAAKPVAGLGVTRRRVGELVIYTIGPGPRALHGGEL